ncbi:MAG: ATP-dependent DNA ligase [Candidatus Aenigmarchaeota archaeon]|nr:ATP-dependent DNA ligase [Candidatus Aenigmarchaeota archaeon]
MLYSELCDALEKIEKNSMQNYKVKILSELFEKAQEDEIEMIVMLCLANVFPVDTQKELGISSQIIAQTISKAFNIPKKTVIDDWIKKGDLGLTSQNLCNYRTQTTLFSTELTIQKVFSSLQKLADISGSKAQAKKIDILTELLASANKTEAKFIVRTVIGQLRVGISEGLVKEAILFSFFTQIYWKGLLMQKRNDKKVFEDILKIQNKKIIIENHMKTFFEKKDKKQFNSFMDANDVEIIKKDKIEKLFKNGFFVKDNSINMCIVEDVEFGNKLKSTVAVKINNAYQVTNNLSLIAKTSKIEGESGLDKLKMQLFSPIKVMLAQKAKSFEDAFERVGKPAVFEYKYDGMRMQIHKNDNIQIYTRMLEDVTKQFPEIKDTILKNVKCKNCVIEGEAVGIDKNTGEYIPFQYISRRIKRKYDIEKLAREIPVVLHIFDITYFEDKSCLNLPFAKRRKLVEKIIKPDKNIVIAKQIVTSSLKEAQLFYSKALEDKQEGVMIKNQNASYVPGSRVGTMLKLKPILDTLDLVIVGAEYGEGKRKGYLSSFMIACRDEEAGDFLTVGKLGTGLKEKEEEGTTFKEISGLIDEDILTKTDRSVFVKPNIVVEVAFEEIQKSANYNSGFALRFPRFITLRPDKSINDINTISDMGKIFSNSRK